MGKKCVWLTPRRVRDSSLATRHGETHPSAEKIPWACAISQNKQLKHESNLVSQGCIFQRGTAAAKPQRPPKWTEMSQIGCHGEGSTKEQRLT